MARFEVFQDRREQWRWRLVANNNRKIATSGEAFSTRYDATRAAETVKKLAPGATMPAQVLARALQRRVVGR
jgi:uncharacterized protein